MTRINYVLSISPVLTNGREDICDYMQLWAFNWKNSTWKLGTTLRDHRAFDKTRNRIRKYRPPQAIVACEIYCSRHSHHLGFFFSSLAPSLRIVWWTLFERSIDEAFMIYLFHPNLRANATIPRTVADNSAKANAAIGNSGNTWNGDATLMLRDWASIIFSGRLHLPQ